MPETDNSIITFNKRFKPGDKVRHFKRELQTEQEIKDNPDIYLYEIVGLANHSETDEVFVIYKVLYKKDEAGNYKLCARPIDMFISEVDHKKYPEIKQQYRFEKI